MSNQYKAVLWNKFKKTYDLILWAGILLLSVSLAIFQLLLYPDITLQTLIIRVSAITAFVLLHIILIIGPLCRLDERFLPLLYNRRHMGVSMFLIALIHGGLSMVQFHTLGDTDPLTSLLTSNAEYRTISEFPFQILGFTALVVLFFMAATSHDFWLKNLTPRIWKILHMGVYIAFGLIIAHVITGALQYESHPIYWVLIIVGFIIVAGLHLYTGIIEYKKLLQKLQLEKDGFFKVARVDDIPNNEAKTVFVNGENIAVFKYDQQVSAVSNVCKHQMGPIGEGKIIDGCITCPWHGYQYLPENGQSPPPFEERLKTFHTKIVDNTIFVHPDPRPPGTFITPAKIEK